MVSSASPLSDLPPSSALARLVLGPPGPVRDGVRRLLMTVPSRLFTATLLAICSGLGFAHTWQTNTVIAYSAAGFCFFYVALRGGFAARMAETTLAFPLVLFNVSGVVLAYALVPMARGLALQWLCLIILVDMRRLSPLQARVAALTAYGLLIVTVCAIWKFKPASIDMGAEVLNVGMAIVTLGVLLGVTHIGQRLNRHRKQQRKELERTVKQLNALSIKDGLTQLINRRHARTLLEEEMRRSQRCGRRFAVAILDIDFFKRVNDVHGHGMGDAVLRDVSRVAQAAIGPTHALARWGGEEFLLLMPETSLSAGLATVERIRKAVREHDWQQHANDLKVTISAGVCEHDGSPQLTSTLERADKALYQAKREGRDRVVAFETLITVLAASS